MYHTRVRKSRHSVFFVPGADLCFHYFKLRISAIQTTDVFLHHFQNAPNEQTESYWEPNV